MIKLQEKPPQLSLSIRKVYSLVKSKKLPLIKILTQKFEDYSEKELYAMIICGEVSVAGETIRKPQVKVEIDKAVIFKKKRFVSRGGEKLDFALSKWGVSTAEKVVLDAGSSTGGFTDCLLQRGAVLVHSVDVGFNQLDYRLRKDSRVNVLEKTNIMSLVSLDPQPDFAVADLSFRSITGAANLILNLTRENLLIALIKPQFEIEPDDDFDGIIRDKEVLKSVVYDTAQRLADAGIAIGSVLESPIKGGKGNTEYLFSLHAAGTEETLGNSQIVNSLFSNQS